MVQSDILLKHLSTVFDPELGANIVDLGMVKDVEHKCKNVTIDGWWIDAGTPERIEELETKLI